MDLTLSIPDALNERIHALPHGNETLGEKVLRILNAGVDVVEMVTAIERVAVERARNDGTL